MNIHDATEQSYKNGYREGYKDGYKDGKEESTGEAVWIIDPDGYYPYCSHCHYEPERYLFNKDNRTPCCPNCGFKMRKENEVERQG